MSNPTRAAVVRYPLILERNAEARQLRSQDRKRREYVKYAVRRWAQSSDEYDKAKPGEDCKRNRDADVNVRGSPPDFDRSQEALDTASRSRRGPHSLTDRVRTAEIRRGRPAPIGFVGATFAFDPALQAANEPDLGTGARGQGS